MFNKKYLFKAIIASLFFLIILLSFLFTAKFSINEITADNFKSKLSLNNASILIDNQLDQHIPDKFPITFAHEFLDAENFNNNGLNIKNTKVQKGNHVEISSSNNRLVYYLNFHQNALVDAYIFKYGLMDENMPNTYFIKKIINDMIIKDGFSLKRTDSKSGNDIIIKETDDSFIIGNFFSYDDIIPPQYITINSYRKHKYLNFLRFD